MSTKVTVHVGILEVHINTVSIEIEPRASESVVAFKNRCREMAGDNSHAESAAADGEPEFDLEYSHSLDENLWSVEVL